MKAIRSIFLSLILLFFSFSSFAVHPWPDVAVPTWELKRQQVFINWVTNADQKDIVYVIEKSRNGKTFSTEMMVMGGFEVSHQFEFSCRFTYEAGTQYRIKQMNNFGQYRIIDSKVF